ncbi:MAG: ribbon-helix-helix protein, CopG family [Acidobacteriia bacterium]|nr:ribbon-helix-helix protein, CopG family [Terriglobia bacterium]
MRITISLKERLAGQVRREAAARGVSVSAFVAATLDDALKRRPAHSSAVPFRLITAGGNGPLPGVDLDRPRAIEIADDEASYRHRGS